jgi:hypothetical protein
MDIAEINKRTQFFEKAGKDIEDIKTKIESLRLLLEEDCNDLIDQLENEGYVYTVNGWKKD